MKKFLSKKGLVKSITLTGSVTGILMFIPFAIDYIKGIPFSSTIMSIFSYCISFKLWLFLLLLILLIIVSLGYVVVLPKLQQYKRYEVYFPDRITAPIIWIEIKKGDVYQLGALADYMYKNLPIYDISREGNVMVAYLKNPFNVKEVTTKVEKIKKEKGYIDFDFTIVNGSTIYGINFSVEWAKSVDETAFINKFMSIVMQELSDPERMKKLSVAYKLLNRM